jgi:hypothetical protein
VRRVGNAQVVFRKHMTVTVITLLKRRAGMSKADFITYYETRHRLIGEKVLRGYATRYVRRFLHPTDGIDQEQDADVVLERGALNLNQPISSVSLSLSKGCLFFFAYA